MLEGKEGWRWEAGGGITSLYFTYLLSFRKPFCFYISFSTGLGL